MNEVPTHRPAVAGNVEMVVAGHCLAAQAGFDILRHGGNAIDAGVAAGLALGVVQSDRVNIAGVAPILVHLRGSREVLSISGVGPWPRAASCDLFRRNHHGTIPEGVLRTVVPAAPDAWLAALEHFGTMSFKDVAAAAIRFARDGFPMHSFMADKIGGNVEKYARWPSNAKIYLPGGRPPAVGEVFVQTDLAASLQYLADEETAASKAGREAGLRAARDTFYRGDIAAAIIKFHGEHGGLLSAADLAEFRVEIEPALGTSFLDTSVYVGGPWCQGPVLLQALSMLDMVDVKTLGHNSPEYIHTISEVLKLAFADRHAYYGDPRCVDVPLGILLSREYAKSRLRCVNPSEASPGMPPAGSVAGRRRVPVEGKPSRSEVRSAGPDTSYVCVIDKDRNVFSATPSDFSYDTPVVPGTGLCPSSRGSQSWTDPAHPAAIAPGKRPRLTPSPAVAFRNGEVYMPFGSPGGDVQLQAMLQAFLNNVLFDMIPQEAVEAPRFASLSFPESFEPHRYVPGRLSVEGRISSTAMDRLRSLGHKLEAWYEWEWRSGGVCMAAVSPRTGVLHGGADPRRPSHAAGW